MGRVGVVQGLLVCLGALLVPGLAKDFAQIAEDYAPLLRFDKKEGEGNLCFPHNAADFYAQRMAGDWSRKCNTDYNSLATGQIPTYWHAMTCGYHLHIAYWNFYGYNADCDCCSGERDAWWEYMVVKIRDWDLYPRLHEVMFGQKKGWYTRIPGHYQTFGGTHPVAFVGKTNHGYYHNDGGSGTCCYYEDYRNPGGVDKRLQTWKNLVELKREGGDPWMTDSNPNPWNGQMPPTFRDNWNLCNLPGCAGSSLLVCGKSGCHKSDIGDDPF
ncbi:uncharacterized protein [Panulirus ornatus]|uniref:uncharacterized protein n=1 Tax=Panulirus ornatus TaxID=150431 RepID=UPI003A881137